MTQQQQRTAEGTMLKYLTQKLRTHSLNEEVSQDKADDDHDSGTESDDEFQNSVDIADNDFSCAMDSFDEPVAGDSAVPSDVDLGTSPVITRSFSFQHIASSPKPKRSLEFFAKSSSSQNGDHHSSEEELEVINASRNFKTTPSRSVAATAVSPQCPSRPSAGPEKRKWSEANRTDQSTSHCFDDQNSSGYQRIEGATAYSAPVSRTRDRGNGSCSSDDELQEISFARSGSAVSQPLRFRSSPPLDVHKPGRSLSPPPKLFHASTSADTRPQVYRPHSRPRPHHPHRPQLHSSLDYLHQAPHQFDNSFAFPSTSSIDSNTATASSNPFCLRNFVTASSSNSSSFENEECGDLDILGACSPRKRHRPPQKTARPCLNFEKMQQIKTQAVTNWRHTSEHGNKERSVFCW